MVLTRGDLDLLRQLKAAGGRGRTVRAFDIRVTLDRLAKGGFVYAQATGLEMVNYRIAKRGKDAIEEHDLN